jgi:glycosyltransferase involved in cell wall biosynthesis
MRLNILISAYYCSPYRGGESAVGWRIATKLAETHDVTVICGDLAENGLTREDIVRFSNENSLPYGLTIHHIQAKGLTQRIHDLHALPGLWFLFYEAYRRWQLQALRVAKKLHQSRPFDLIHHVNVIGFREPGYLWRMGIPFFWGPASGAPMVPAAFIKDFSLKEKFRWRSRNLLYQLQIRLAGRAAKAARIAVKVWAVSHEDQELFNGWGVKADRMLETGCLIAEGIKPRTRENDEPLRLCWSGLFQGIKALPILLKAIASIDRGNITLDILGDGVEAESWKTLAASMGLDKSVTWHGMLCREDALKIMHNNHVLIHTSVKEGTPHVVLEAMTMGMPVICHDACGMGTAVTTSCGIKIPMVDAESSIRGFQDAILRLASDPKLLESLSAGALARAAELSWDAKIEEFIVAYSSVISSE